MKSLCRGILTIAATSLFAAASPTYAKQPTEPDLLANAAKIAHEFRHPLLREGDGKASIDQELWYVVDDFGDPYGKACRTPQSRVCYSVGENWTHVTRPLGKPVRAVANGEILEFGYSRRSGGKLPDSLGNYILIKHSLPAPGLRIPGIGRVTTVVSLYAYLRDLKGICGNNSRSCRVGQRVRIGGLIGHVGDTGAAKIPSLHFEIRLADEKCIKGARPGTISESCFGYARDRYPTQYEGERGWLDPTCFIEQKRAPRNDNIAKAISIDVGQTAKGSNRCATKEEESPTTRARELTGTVGTTAESPSGGNSRHQRVCNTRSARLGVNSIRYLVSIPKRARQAGN
jgi:murein DD-endopeptidase MepM/ murein hydrolase activator NlpD